MHSPNAKQRRNAIVTGGASGLGRALCLALARRRWHIAVCDINPAGSEETARLVTEAGGTAQVEPLDVTDIAAWQDLSHRLRQQWANIDLLCNNAGVAGAGEVGTYPLDNWRWVLEINLWNGINGCHTFVDWLKANPRGAHIMNTASLAAIGSAPSMGAYNVSKAGMVSLSETLYAELLPHNVGVTVLCPAFFPTNLLAEGRFDTPEMKGFAERAFKRSNFTAEDVAQAALAAMDRKQLYVVLPASGRFQWLYKRMAPQRFLKKVSQIVTGQTKRRTEAAADSVA